MAILDPIARPFGMLLMSLYDFFGNYGVALLIFALLVRVILLPFTMKSKYGTMRQGRLQPRIAELQKKHGDNKQKIQEETQKLWKSEGINPMSGCLWGFIPLPIMLALFSVIRNPLTMMLRVAQEHLDEGGLIFEKFASLEAEGLFTPAMGVVYRQVEWAEYIGAHFNEFVEFTAQIPTLRPLAFNFLGLNLGNQPQYDFLWNTDWSDAAIWLPGLFLFLIPLISGASQFLSARINKLSNPAMASQTGSMNTVMMLMPLFSVYIGFVTPAALGLYWTAGTILIIGQDLWLTKKFTKRLDAEDAVKKIERDKKEAEIEAKRIETEKRKAAGIVENNPNISKRKKQTSEKQGQREKAAEWEKKKAGIGAEEKSDPSRIDNRRYARGRAYDPDRFTHPTANDNDDNDNVEEE